jgi:demethylmenaquinone methyltransferase/2-methoxy-6-polyprenyl-1,4-benzoquinol methylase
VLEFSLPRNALLRGIYRPYLHWWVPRVGALLTGQQSAYDYLGETIEKFPRGEAMLNLMRQSGLEEAKAESLSGGIVTIYTATR